MKTVKHWFELGNLSPDNTEKCLNCQSAGDFSHAKTEWWAQGLLLTTIWFPLHFSMSEQFLTWKYMISSPGFFPPVTFPSVSFGCSIILRLSTLHPSCSMVLRFHQGWIGGLLWGGIMTSLLPKACSHRGMCQPLISLHFPPRSFWYAIVLHSRDSKLNKAHFLSCWDLPCSGANARSDILKLWPGPLAQRRELGALLGEEIFARKHAHWSDCLREYILREERVMEPLFFLTLSLVQRSRTASEQPIHALEGNSPVSIATIRAQ